MLITKLVPALGLSSVLLASSAFAGSNMILSCKGKDWKAVLNKVPTGIELVETTTYTNFRTKQQHDETQRAVLSLLGRVNLGYKNGPTAGKDPVVAFVDKKNPGKNYAYYLLATGNTPKTHYFELSMNDGHTGLSHEGDCTEGPAYAAFAKVVKAGAPTRKADFDDYRDDQMAMRCRPTAKGDAGVEYAVRALHMGFGYSEIQVQASNSKRDFASSLDHFEESGDQIQWVQGEDTIQYPPVPKGMAFVLKKTPTVVAGKKIYSAEYFDGKGSSVQLACDPRWTIESNIFAALAEKNSKKASLPSAGTLAQAEKRLCDKADDLEKILGQYGDLIMKVPGVNGVGLGAYTPKESPFGIRCYKVSVMVADEKDLANAKKTIGESLLGYLVDYEVVGVIMAQ